MTITEELYDALSNLLAQIQPVLETLDPEGEYSAAYTPELAGARATINRAHLAQQLPRTGARARYYVGIRPNGDREIFTRHDATTPTAAMYPQYSAVIGPHRTRRGADFMASPAAVNNPHAQTAADADRIASH